MENKQKMPISEIVGIAVSAIASSLFGAFCVWAMVQPYGKTRDEVSEEFWNLKVRMASQYAEVTGNTHFLDNPEDVQLLVNNDGSCYAYFRTNFFTDRGESYSITNPEDISVIEAEAS